MPYPKFDPAPEELMMNVTPEELEENAPSDEADMRKKRYMGHHTICEKIRELWRIGKELEKKGIEEGKEIQFKAREAMSMSKSMHNRLKWYRDYTGIAKYK